MTGTLSGKIACRLAVFCLASVFAAEAQTLTTITNLPYSLTDVTQFVEGQDGNLLANSEAGGKYGVGAIIHTSFTGQPSVL